MQLPGQNLPVQQEWVRANLPAAGNSAGMLPLSTVIQTQPLHSAAAPSLESAHPHFCFFHTVHILHFRIIACTEFSVYKWIQQSWLGEKTEDQDLHRFQLDWNPPHLGYGAPVGAASIGDVWCGLGLKPVIRQAIVWLKHLEDDEAAKKPGVQTEITDLTWRYLLHQASSLEGQENPWNLATFNGYFWRN